MLKKIIVTGGDSRFANELKRLNLNINLFLEIKNNSIFFQLNLFKII